MNLQIIMLSKKKMPVLKGYILYGSMYVTFLKWQNYNNTEKN